MNGRTEKEMILDKKITEKLQDYPAIITEFYEDMKDNGKTMMTVKSYTNNVIHFANAVSGKKIKEDFYKRVTTADIKRYMNSIKISEDENGNPVEVGDEFRAQRWSALNAFFIFLKDNDYIDENPMNKTKRPRAKVEHTVTYLTPDEIKAVYRKIQGTANKKFVNRDLCIFTLAVKTGLRVSAICNINIKDIDFNENTITVVEKGKKKRQIMFGDNMKEMLKAWIKDRKTYFKEIETDALFVSQFKKRITTDMVRVLIKKYTDGVTTKHITPHKLRASCAVNIYDQTKDIMLVRDMLGHENVETTMRYTRAAEESKKEAVAFMDELI